MPKRILVSFSSRAAAAAVRRAAAYATRWSASRPAAAVWPPAKLERPRPVKFRPQRHRKQQAAEDQRQAEGALPVDSRMGFAAGFRDITAAKRQHQQADRDIDKERVAPAQAGDIRRDQPAAAHLPDDKAIPPIPPYRLIARAWALPFNVTCRVVRICGTISAAPAPCSVRAASSPPMELAMPHSKEARPKARPHINRRRRP